MKNITSLLSLFLLTTHYALHAQQNVGIGTTSPKAQLHTTGSVRFEALKGAGIRQAYLNDSGNLITAPWYFNNTSYPVGNGCSGTSSPINISGNAVPVAGSRIQVRVYATEDYNPSLHLFLISPGGQILNLTHGTGLGANFYGTVFSDGATQTLGAGSAPYGGTYKPVGSTAVVATGFGGTSCPYAGNITTFAGFGAYVVPNGTWTLKAIDLSGYNNDASINSWAILFDSSYTFQQPPVGVNYVAKGSAAGTLTSSSIYDNGYVGIGTTSPTELLHVASGGPTTALIEGTSASVNNYTNNVALGLKTPNNEYLLAALAMPNSSYGFTIYDVLHGANRLVIAPGGNVGIGTTSPTAQFHTTGSLRFENLNAGFLQTDASGNVSTTSIGGASILNQNSYTQSATFNINGNGIFKGGYVGVGDLVSTPNFPIQTATSGRDAAQFYSTNTAGTWLSIKNSTGNSADWRLYATGSGNSSQGGANKLIFRENNIGYDVLTMTPNNRVGISVTSPDYTLHVRNDDITNQPIAEFENQGNSVNSAGVLIKVGKNSNFNSLTNYPILLDFQRPDGTDIGQIIQSTASTILYGNNSDIRLKEHIRATHYGLPDLLKIQVRDYNYIGDSTAQTGYLAQQLYTVFPDAVKVGGEDVKKNHWMVDYGRITPLIIKGMQDLNEKIEALAKENNELKAKLAAAEQRGADVTALAQQVKEMQQMLGIKLKASGAKTARR